MKKIITSIHYSLKKTQRHMKIKFTLLIIFLTRVVPSLYSQTQLNHHEYGVSNNFNNRYTLAHSGCIELPHAYFCGGVYDYLNTDFTDEWVRAFVTKTNLDGNPFFNKIYFNTGTNPNLALNFHSILEYNNDVYVAALLANNQIFGLVKLNSINGTIISYNFYEVTLPSSIFGTRFNISKLLPKPNSTNIFVIGSAEFNDGSSTTNTRKAVVFEYDANLNLINFNAYQLPQNVVGPVLTEESFTVTDALIHYNNSSNLDELVIVGESNSLDKYIGAAYNHISACMLRINTSNLNPLMYNFYPHIFNQSPIMVEGSIATSIAEHNNSLYISGSLEHMIGRMALFMLKTDEMGNVQQYDILNMRGNDPNYYITRPTSIFAKEINNNIILTVSGEIRGASYTNYFNPLKYNASNSVFTFDYNFTISQILYSKTFDIGDPVSLYLSDVLKINDDNYLYIGNNLNTSSLQLSLNNLSTVFFVNQINLDNFNCVKTDEGVTDLNLTLGHVTSKATMIQPNSIPYLSVSLGMDDNDDERICEEPVEQMLNTELVKSNVSVEIFDLTTSELVKHYSVELDDSQVQMFNMSSLPPDVNLIRGRLYAVKINNNSQSKRIFKFIY